MRYVLDSSALIPILRDHRSRPAIRARQERLGEIVISSIAVQELYFGAFKSMRVASNVAVLDALRLPIIEFDRDDARRAGEIRAVLSAAGQMIGPYDLLIAGQAAARDLILVTHNVRAFARVPGLRIEDWEA